LKKAVFLDRDGVINQLIIRKGKPQAPYSLKEFALMDGVSEAFELLRKTQLLLIIVTNQPDVARGWVAREMVDLVNQKIQEILAPDEIKVCFHTEKDNCLCRKPRPGMLLEAARSWNIDTAESYMIGDRLSDVAAGKAAGCKTILIGPGDNALDIIPDYRHDSLLSAAKQIVREYQYRELGL
jgi:D-glycero-D-manno-heptose 1,7-bisphosphate phosphatase